MQNATRACAHMMQKPQEIHMPALTRLAHYMVSTPERGLVLHPNRTWDGSKDFKFQIVARSDSNYASNTDDRRSVTGVQAMLEGCPITFCSNTQKYVTLLVTEAESGAGTTAPQDMMYVYHLTESVGLQVEMPMVLEMDNKGAVDMANNWSAGGRTHHIWMFACIICVNLKTGALSSFTMCLVKTMTLTFSQRIQPQLPS